MNKLFTACAFICAAFLFGCKKETQNPQADLFIAATKNGSAWKANVSAEYTPNRDSVILFGSKVDTDEHLSIKFKFTGKGVVTIDAKDASFLKLVLGDILDASYKVDATKTNTVTVSSFSIGNNIAVGDFMLNFIKEAGSPTAPETLVFTNGKFWAQLPAVK